MPGLLHVLYITSQQSRVWVYNHFVTQLTRESASLQLQLVPEPSPGGNVAHWQGAIDIPTATWGEQTVLTLDEVNDTINSSGKMTYGEGWDQDLITSFVHKYTCVYDLLYKNNTVATTDILL